MDVSDVAMGVVILQEGMMASYILVPMCPVPGPGRLDKVSDET